MLGRSAVADVRLNSSPQSCNAALSIALDRGKGQAGKSDCAYSHNNDFHAHADRIVSFDGIRNDFQG